MKTPAVTVQAAVAAARRTRDNYQDTTRFMCPAADPVKAWDEASDRIVVMAKFILAEHDKCPPVRKA